VILVTALEECRRRQSKCQSVLFTIDDGPPLPLPVATKAERCSFTAAPKKDVMQSKKEPLQSHTPTTLLIPQTEEDLRGEIQQVQRMIARRAYYLFMERGCRHGLDQEDWFRAEEELLRPISVSLSESDDRISVRVNVPDLEESEVKVSIEPRRITILGKKKISAMESEGRKVEHIDWSPNRIFRLIDLATEVMPENSVAELQAGELKFELPKVAKGKVEAAVAAA
jgi:HSP20 family protein